MKIFFLIAIFTPVLVFLLRVPSVALRAKRYLPTLYIAGLSVAVLVILATIGVGLLAAAEERVRFHDEPTVLCIAAAFLHGQSLYPTTGSPAEYALLYGPATYLVYTPPMLLGAVRLRVFQLWVTCALAGAYFFFFHMLRPRLGLRSALFFTGVLAVFVALLPDSELATKSDVWILLCSALGFWAAVRLPRWPAALVIAAAGAMLIDFKVTLPLVALLPCIVLGQRERLARTPAVLSLVAMPCLALLPFASPAISLAGYGEQLHAAGHHGCSPRLFGLNLRFTATMLLPLAAAFWLALTADKAKTFAWIRERKAFLLALAAAIVVADVTGAKIGAGPWHCMVVAVPLVWLTAHLGRMGVDHGSTDIEPSRLAPAMIVAVGLCGILLLVLRTAVGLRLHDPAGDVQVSMPAVEGDLLRLAREHAGVALQMGYSDEAHYNLSFVRPVLQILGSPLLLDADARNEATLVAAPPPPAVLVSLRQCTVKLWIVPKGEPFSMISPYFLEGSTHERDLYPEAFRSVFFNAYQKIPSGSAYFDLWACRSV